MKNTVVIGTLNNTCVCECFDCINNNSNTLFIEVLAKNSASRLNVYLNDTLKETITLTSGTKNIVEISTDYFEANGVIKVQCVDSAYTGQYFYFNFPAELVGNMSLTQSGTYTFMVKYVDTTAPEVEVIDNLDSTSDADALSANMGRVLDEKIDAIPTVDIIDNLTSTSATSALSANQGKVINDTFTSHNNNQSKHGGITLQTTNTATRLRLAFYMDRSVALIMVKKNTSAANSMGLFMFTYDKSTYALTRIAGDITLTVDSYSYDTTNSQILVVFSGFSSWAMIDIISHRLKGTNVIA